MTRYAVRTIYKVKKYAYTKEIKEYYFDKYEDAKKDYDLGCKFLCDKFLNSSDYDKRIVGVILASQDIDEYSGEIETFIIEEKFKRDRKHRKHNLI